MRKHAGISLVETIFALGLVALVVILVVDLYPSAMATLRQAERQSVATNLASSVLDQEMALPFTQLTVGSQTLPAQVTDGITYTPRVEIFNYQPAVTPAVDSNRLIGVRVIVDWEYRKVHRTLVREALVHNLPP